MERINSRKLYPLNQGSFKEMGKEGNTGLHANHKNGKKHHILSPYFNVN
jgi:hypothetical protein